MRQKHYSNKDHIHLPKKGKGSYKRKCDLEEEYEDETEERTLINNVTEETTAKENKNDIHGRTK